MKLPFEADEIVPGLWQGPLPPRGDVLRKFGFDAVVLASIEWQFEDESFGGITVIRAPNRDDGSELTREQLTLAVRTARQCVPRIRGGQKVLVTCTAGVNRSGLVSALTLHFLNGWSGSYCREVVRAQRKPSCGLPPLCNQHFSNALLRLPARNLEEAPPEPLILVARS